MNSRVARRRVWVAAVGGALGVLSISALVVYLRQQGASENLKFSKPPSPQETPKNTPARLPEDAPDSFVGIEEKRIIVFSSESGGELRELTRKEETQSPRNPYRAAGELSTDGTYVYFDELIRLEPLCEFRIKRVPLGGGSPEMVAIRGIQPAVSPDGRSLAYITGKSDCYGRTIVIRDLSTARERRWSQALDIPNYDLEHDAVFGLGWSPESRYLLYGLSSEEGSRTVLFDPAKESDLKDPKLVLPDREHLWTGFEWRTGGGIFLAGECCGAEDRRPPKHVEYDPIEQRIVRQVPQELISFSPFEIHTERSGKHLLISSRFEDPQYNEVFRWHGERLIRVNGGLLNADWW